MSSTTKELLLGTVVPILGGIVAIIMYASPLKATVAARREQHLGELNPVPFAVTFASTAAWCAYGFAAPDFSMFLPNIPGFGAAIFTTVSCYALATLRVQSIPLSIMCGSSAIILLLGVMTRFVMAGQQARLMWYFARARGVWQLMRPCGCVCDSVCDTAAQLRLTVRRPDARKQEVNNFTA